MKRKLFKLKRVATSVATLAAALFMSAALTGCGKDKPVEPQPTGRIAVNLTTDIKSASTLKVLGDYWEANDKVGLFMKRAGVSLTASDAVYSDADNAQMSITGSALTSTPPVLYPETGNVDFIAYYPYATSVGADFTIPVNVAGQSEGLPVEVLYSDNVKNQAAVPTAVRLDFLYSLAKVEITVTAGANVDLSSADFGSMTATVEGFNTQATLQLAGGTLTDMQSKQSITLYRKSSDDASAVFEALLLPVTVSAGEVVFIFTVGGVSYRYEAEGNYEAATLYELDIELEASRTGVLTKPRNVVPRSFTALKVENDDAHEMVFVQGGKFTMGVDDFFGHITHEVTLDSYSIGKYQVTQSQWVEVMGSNPSWFSGENKPVETVSWNDIVGTSSSAVGYTVNEITYYQNGFCYKYSQLAGDGKHYRLPTEAEWEFAARGGNQTNNYIYSGSNNIDDVAWYRGNIPSQNSSDPGYGTQPVGTKAPNELGIYDMSGNVYEWCGDWWSSYTSDNKTNPTGPTSGSSRVLRGSFWSISAESCRVANRNYSDPDARDGSIGFRLACSSE